MFPFFVLGIVPIFANNNYTLTIRSGAGGRDRIPYGQQELFMIKW